MRVDEMGMQVEIEIANREAGAHSTHTHTPKEREGSKSPGRKCERESLRAGDV